MDNNINSLVVIIPAYKPEKNLINLTKDLQHSGFSKILIINDGSGEEYDYIFKQLEYIGAQVVRHAVNLGKGRALKTGINNVLINDSEVLGVITADADGQHKISDIIKVGEELLVSKDTIILGGRTFSGKVPLKSRLGNAATRTIFNFVSGLKIHDTQTGLRGLPYNSLRKLISLSGERYDYEMEMLLETQRLGLKLKEIEIETVYIEENKGSHFNPLKDSLRIYKYVTMFALSSMAAFLVDASVYALIITAFPQTAQSTIVWIPSLCSRIISSTVNFMANRNVIFAKEKKGSLRRHIIGYYTLATFILIGGIAIISLLKSLGVSVYIGYLVSLLLFFASYTIQKNVIFK